MQAELGYCPVVNDSNSGKTGVQFPYGTNESDEISKFLDSILNVPEDCDNGQLNMGEIGIKAEAKAECGVAKGMVSTSSSVLNYLGLLSFSQKVIFGTLLS